MFFLYRIETKGDNMQEIVVVGAKRTAIGSFLGSLKNNSAVDLASQLGKKLLEDLNLNANLIDELILGQVLSHNQGQNPARQVLLNIGAGKEKTAFVVNKVCGSSLKAINLGFNSLALSENEVVLAGGAESMSLSPFMLANIRNGHKMGEGKLIDSMIKDGLWCAINNYHMGITAENIAAKYKISRQRLDEFALNSHQKASLAIKEGKFKNEIIALDIKDKKGTFVFDTDEGVRFDANSESLAKLKPAFLKEGCVSAGNSSTLNDGAAFVLMMSKAKAKELGLPILAKIKGFASVGVDPEIMGVGAAYAAKKLLDKFKLNVKDIDLFEANEAFASQSLATIDILKAPLQKVNINGGAIALGHPIGASGARILTSLIYALRDHKLNLGLATLCIGGGQGIAALIEIDE